MMRVKGAKEVSFVALLVLVSFITLTDGVAVMSVDLGSQFFKVAIVKPGVPMEIALNRESRRKTPQVVTLRDDERLFGDPAYGMSVKYPKSSYLYIHDVLGKKIENPLVQTYKQRFPFYDLVKDEERGSVLFQHNGETKYSPEEILAMTLNTSRDIAEKFADHPIKDAVITVPAFFNQAERRAVIIAAHMVGLNVLQLMNDNVAVALNYGVFRRGSFNGSEKLIMFYDMGASSTEATIVGYSTVDAKDRGIVEKTPQLSVKAIGFDRTLGGREFDFRLRDHLVKLFKATHKTKGEVTENPRAMAKFLKEAVRVKQVLSANSEFFAQIEGAFEEQDFRAKVTRTELEEMCQDLLERVPGPVEKALKSSQITLDEIDAVILVGGGTRVPKVQELLLKAVKKPELGKSINADEAAAMGAVYQAANLATGFRVKKFIIRDANVYPIQVSFERKIKDENEQDRIKYVKRTLFHHMNTIPQRKVMTFNKHVDDFSFHVGYNVMDVLNEEELKMHGDLNLTTVSLKGVADALNKHTPAGESKGVKAYFRMDESGILTIEKVESVFEKMPEDESQEQSTFSKLGSKISSFFTGSKEGESTDTKPEEGKDNAETSKTEESAKNEEDGEKDSSEKTEEKPEEENAKTSDEKDSKKKEEDSSKDSTENTDEEGKEETKEEGKTEDKSEEKKDDSSEKKADDKSKNKTDTEKSGNTTESAEKEKKVVKPVTVRELLDMNIEVIDLARVSDDNFVQSKKKLEELMARDLQKFENEKSKNALEAFIFSTRDLVYSDVGEKLTTEEEREKINTALSETSDWLDEDGWDTTADVYNGKIKKLQEVTEGLSMRRKEHEGRPQALEGLMKSLNLSETFLKQVHNMTDKDEIYSAKDLTDMEKVTTETKDWLVSTQKKQEETKLHEKPVLLVKDIEYRQAKLERELLFLLNKAKYYVPKPKPKAENTTESANATKTNTTTEEKTADNKTEKTSEDPKEEKDKPKEEKSSDEKSEEKPVEEKATEEKTAEEDKKEEKEPTLELPPSDETTATPTTEEPLAEEQTVTDTVETPAEETVPSSENLSPDTKAENHHNPDDEL